MKNIDVNINNQNIKLTMDVNDVSEIRSNIDRFKSSINELSNRQMSAECDIYEIDTPVTSVTYSEEFGYYLDPDDVRNIIKDYLEQKEYDYIFVAVRLGDMKENIEIPVYDWIGLRKYGFRWNWLFKYKTSKQ